MEIIISKLMEMTFGFELAPSSANKLLNQWEKQLALFYL